MSTPRVERVTRVKRLAINCRVSGKFGDWLPASDPSKKRSKARIYGTVIEPIDHKRYNVLWDNNTILDCYSNSLKVEDASTIPPDIPVLPNDLPPATQDIDMNLPTEAHIEAVFYA